MPGCPDAAQAMRRPQATIIHPIHNNCQRPLEKGRQKWKTAAESEEQDLTNNFQREKKLNHKEVMKKGVVSDRINRESKPMREKWNGKKVAAAVIIRS